MRLRFPWKSVGNNDSNQEIGNLEEKLCQIANRVNNLRNNDKYNEAVGKIQINTANDKALISALLDLTNQLLFELEHQQGTKSCKIQGRSLS